MRSTANHARGWRKIEMAVLRLLTLAQTVPIISMNGKNMPSRNDSTWNNRL